MSEEQKKGAAYYICFGMLFGVAFGAALKNVGLGLVLGYVAGYAYYKYKVKSDKKNNDNDTTDKE